MSLSELSDNGKNVCFKDKDNEENFSDPITKDEEKQNVTDVKIENSGNKVHVKRSRKSSRKKIESLQTAFEIYQCVHCPLTFNRLSQLKSHSKSHLGENSEKLECNVCSLVVDSAKSLNSHRRQHAYSPRCYKCLLCNTEYNHQTSFRIHMRMHKGEKPYVCKECGASFSQSGHLSIHKRTHTGEKPYTCEICSNNFKQISHLKTHVRTHTHDKPYRCNLCSAAFTQNSSLKRHNRVHTGEKPYQCVHCGMNFVVKSNMQRHLNTHTGERPFQCDLCPASFGQAIDLKRHKISHTGVKPYKCELCNASFSRKNNLKWHKLTHSENAGYHCNICFVGFSSTGDLKTHMRIHAPPKPYSCDICPSSFRLPESLSRHKMIHTGEKPLRHKSNKQNSVKEANSKPFNCLLCSASFCEKRNLKRHTFSVHHNFGIIKSPCNSSQMKEDEKLPCDSQAIDTTDTNIETHKASENYVQQLESSDMITNISATSYSIPSSTVPQVAMQSISNLEGVSQIPQFFISIPGQAPRPARPAGYCLNHNLHILTYVEGSFNHWQSWCFCSPPNIPESPPQVIVPSIPSEMSGETMAQILITPTQTASPQDSSQVLMNMNPQPVTDASNQIFFSPTFLNQNITVAPNYFGAFALNGGQPFELQGNILQNSNATFFKGIKSEN